MAAPQFTVNSATSITATVPPNYAGTVDVTVVTMAGTTDYSSADLFTYNAAPAPTVTKLSPTTGTSAGGTTLTLTGTHLTGAYEVDFDGVPADFTVLSDTSISAVTPPPRRRRR
jgi:hypothetical protein